MSASQEVGEIFGQGSGPATALLRSPTVIIAAIGLWGMNIYLFRAFGIDYKRAFEVSSSIKKIEKASSMEDSEDPHRKESDGGEENDLLMNNTASTTTISTTDPNEGLLHPILKTSLTTTAIGATPDFTAPRLLVLSITLLILLHVTSYTWIHILGGDAMGAVFCFYALVTAVALYPSWDASAWARRALRILGGRVMELFHPRCYCCSYEMYRPIPFVDVFFADALCSLSKVFFDWGMLWHMASHYPYPVPASAHSIVIPSVCAALPYIIRARQCMVMHTVGLLKNDPKRYQHILNAIKYCSSLFPICLSAYQKTVVTEEEPTKAAMLEGLLIILLLINCCYCFLWDVIMDWGMISDPAALLADPKRHIREPKLCFQNFLRPRLRFGPKISLVILLTNLLLRFAWLLRFWEKRLFPSVDEFVLCTQFLEVFRRALWNLLRVEWEQLKILAAKQQQDQQLHHGKAVMMISSSSNLDEEGDDDDDYFSKNGGISISTMSSSSSNHNNNINLVQLPLLPSRRTLSLPIVS